MPHLMYLAAAAGVPYTVRAEDYGNRKNNGVTWFSGKVNWFRFLFIIIGCVFSKLKVVGRSYAGANWKVAWGYGKKL